MAESLTWVQMCFSVWTTRQISFNKDCQFPPFLHAFACHPTEIATTNDCSHLELVFLFRIYRSICFLSQTAQWTKQKGGGENAMTSDVNYQQQIRCHLIWLSKPVRALITSNQVMHLESSKCPRKRQTFFVSHSSSADKKNVHDLVHVAALFSIAWLFGT